MPTPRYLGANNGFLPVATGQIVGFIRDPKKFKVNRYVQNVQSESSVGLYMKLDRDHPVRVTSDAAFAWEDGDKSPTGHHNLSNFVWEEFRTQRRAYPFTLGNQANSQANKLGGWDPAAWHAKIVASQAITNRVNRIITMLQTAGNWDSNTATADVLNGGKGHWDLASSDPNNPNHLAIKRTLLEVARRIALATNNAVDLASGELKLILSPNAAVKLAETDEIHGYMAHSRHSYAIIKGEDPQLEDTWGLPPFLYGFEVVVEATPIVTRVPSAGDTTVASESAGTRTFIKAEDSAIVVARPGGLDAPLGAPSFSTCQCYWYTENDGGGELDVETRTDDWDRFTEGRCVEQFAEKMPAPHSGFLITDILS